MKNSGFGGSAPWITLEIHRVNAQKEEARQMGVPIARDAPHLVQILTEMRQA